MTNHLKQAIQKNKEVIFPVKDGEEMDIEALIDKLNKEANEKS